MLKIITNSLIGLACTALLGWGVWMTNASYCSAKNDENIQSNKKHIERVELNANKERTRREDGIKDIMIQQQKNNDRIMDKLLEIQKSIK